MSIKATFFITKDTREAQGTQGLDVDSGSILKIDFTLD